jgi:hypothetical protein
MSVAPYLHFSRNCNDRQYTDAQAGLFKQKYVTVGIILALSKMMLLTGNGNCGHIGSPRLQHLEQYPVKGSMYELIFVGPMRGKAARISLRSSCLPLFGHLTS